MIIIIQNHTTWWLSQTLKQPRECSHVLEGDGREDNLQRGKKLERGGLEKGGGMEVIPTALNRESTYDLIHSPGWVAPLLNSC